MAPDTKKIVLTMLALVAYITIVYAICSQIATPRLLLIQKICTYIPSLALVVFAIWGTIVKNSSAYLHVIYSNPGRYESFDRTFDALVWTILSIFIAFCCLMGCALAMLCCLASIHGGTVMQNFRERAEHIPVARDFV